MADQQLREAARYLRRSLERQALRVTLVRAQAGQLHPGAVVLQGSKRCAHQGCKVAFVPRVPWQKYCSPECGEKARKG